MPQLVYAYNFVMLGCNLLAVLTYFRFRQRGVLLFVGVAWALVATALAFYLGRLTFAGILLLSYAIFLPASLLVLATAAIAWKHSKGLSATLAAIAITITAIAIDAFWIEPNWLDVTHISVSSNKVTRKHRICLVADLQTDQLGAHERAAFAAIAREQPDLVVMAGDYLQAPPEDEPELLRQFNQYLREIDFSAPLGVIAVGGNTDNPSWQLLFAGTKVVTLTDTARRTAGELMITGLSVPDSFNTGLTIPAEPSAFHVVVGHAPDYALGQINADLLLAGHTHGGQVQLPGIGPLMTLSQVPRSWASDMTQLPAGRTLFVSRGVGMERGTAPRLRFLCRPQLVVIDVVPSGNPMQAQK